MVINNKNGSAAINIMGSRGQYCDIVDGSFKNGRQRSVSDFKSTSSERLRDPVHEVPGWIFSLQNQTESLFKKI